jgi:hypothetical protein
MANDKYRRRTLRYEPESWRDDDSWRTDASLSPEDEEFMGHGRNRVTQSEPDVRDQTSVLDLLGRINYKIIKGGRVYIEVGGVVYKTLYGGYWRSVFTGVEHYLFRCQQVSGAAWAEETCSDAAVELPIAFSNNGWSASGHSLSFMLSREQTADGKQTALGRQARFRRWTSDLAHWTNLRPGRHRSWL